MSHHRLLYPVVSLCIGLIISFLAASPTLAQSTTHTVAAGESLSKIARQYGVTLYALSSYNNIANPNLIRPGTILRIPATSPPTSIMEKKERVAPVTTAVPRVSPVSPATPGGAPTAKPAATPVPQPTVAIPATPRRIVEISHIVRSGDTLYGLSARYGVSISTIRTRNRLRDNTLIIGQLLMIPASAPGAGS